MRLEPLYRCTFAPTAGGPRRLLGSMTHLSDDDRYRWLNTAMCVLTGEIRPRREGGFDVVLDVAELVWEPPA